MGHINIPIFIPHLGCPNQCIFCNQRHISGTIEFDEKRVETQIQDVLSTVNGDNTTEIAFFGGSFTGIDKNLMIRLLDIAQKYVDFGRVFGIRMSTRPDYITDEILDILSSYKISCIELGIQTVNDDVLTFLKRGHTYEDTKKAIELLNSRKIPFVGQMMIGLPTASIDDELECARFICQSGAVGARIYPTLVFKGTELAELTKKNLYSPLSVEQAVSRSAEVLSVFIENNVPCIRIGLCESENLHSDTTFVAGPNHPSIGELIKSRVYLNLVKHMLDRNDYSGSIIIECPKGSTSQIVGNKKANMLDLVEKFNLKRIQVLENDSLAPYNINIKNKED